MFRRFPDKTLSYLRDLQANNNKAWFRQHAAEYELYYVRPAKAFVVAAGEVLKRYSPRIRVEPRILGSIFRVNRDARYAGATPYKGHIDFWFWEGERRLAVSGFFVRVAPDLVGVGAGCHRFRKAQLSAFRQAVADRRAGSALVDLVNELEGSSYLISGKTRKRVPKGYSVGEGAERFMLFSALFVHHDEPVDVALQDDVLLDVCDQHWRALSGLHHWITENVQDRCGAPEAGELR